MRTGNFTSSSIYLLMSNDKSGGFGKPAQTYIAAKKLELRLGRNLQKERSARPTSWGKLIEQRAFELLGDLSYDLQSDIRYVHPKFPNWTGAPDLVSGAKIADVKCPFGLQVYCEKADLMIEGNVEGLKKEFPENYWQIVSNAILTDRPIGELIIYMPYLSELVDIKHELQTGELVYEGNINDVAWINWAEDEELPYLLPDKYYLNLYKMEWEISPEDKDALTERVKMAIELL